MDIIVKKSGIEGKGVFAARDFAKGEIVLRWDTSRTLLPEQVERLSETEKRYVSYLNGTYILMQSPERFVNHSCESNTRAGNFSDVAKRDIHKGEEVTADYSEEAVPGFSMECRCGCRNCRGTIRHAL